MPSHAVEVEYSMFDYTAYYENPANWIDGVLYADGYLICGEAATSGNVTITLKPGTLTIANNAFQYFDNNSANGRLTAVYFNDGLSIIGAQAFYYCDYLTTIGEIPSTVSTVGHDAFKYTAYYNSDSNWQNNALYVSGWLVAIKDVDLTTLEIKEGTVGVADAADSGSLFSSKARAVTSVSLPSTLRYIGRNSFAYIKVTDIALPSSIVSIGYKAFYQCSALKNVVTEDCNALTTIGDQAFSACSISKIYIPASVLNMGSLIFNHNYTDITVNCGASEKPQGWQSDWSYSYRESATVTVVWAD